jgi:hypothetical protein
MAVSLTVSLRLSILKRRSNGGKEKIESAAEEVWLWLRVCVLEMIGYVEWKIGSDLPGRGYRFFTVGMGGTCMILMHTFSIY